MTSFIFPLALKERSSPLLICCGATCTQPVTMDFTSQDLIAQKSRTLTFYLFPQVSKFEVNIHWLLISSCGKEETIHCIIPGQKIWLSVLDWGVQGWDPSLHGLLVQGATDVPVARVRDSAPQRAAGPSPFCRLQSPSWGHSAEAFLWPGMYCRTKSSLQIAEFLLGHSAEVFLCFCITDSTLSLLGSHPWLTY